MLEGSEKRTPQFKSCEAPQIALLDTFDSKESQEARQAFLEKRSPKGVWR